MIAGLFVGTLSNGRRLGIREAYASGEGHGVNQRCDVAFDGKQSIPALASFDRNRHFRTFCRRARLKNLRRAPSRAPHRPRFVRGRIKLVEHGRHPPASAWHSSPNVARDARHHDRLRTRPVRWSILAPAAALCTAVSAASVTPRADPGSRPAPRIAQTCRAAAWQVYLSFSISSARCFASLSAALARASAASSASRVATIIACALARSFGSESALSAMPLQES
jgi:hypothetical protein